MFEGGFKESMIDTGETVIRVRHGGSGPPLLLLHGNPQTQPCGTRSRRVSPSFTVVATDLRGYGEAASRPRRPITRPTPSGRWRATRSR